MLHEWPVCIIGEFGTEGGVWRAGADASAGGKVPLGGTPWQPRPMAHLRQSLKTSQAWRTSLSHALESISSCVRTIIRHTKERFSQLILALKKQAWGAFLHRL